MADKHKIIGKSERRVDAWGKVTGRAKFAEDYTVGHQLWGMVLRAKFPHAKILSVDISQAASLPGVEAVLTAKDIPGSKTFGIVLKNQAILAEDRVRYLGDGVALVAAASKEIAERAISLIVVEYEPLPVVSDPEEAMKPGALVIHDEKNEFVHHKVRKGDIEKGFAEADFVIERRFKTQFIEHSYIEPECVVAELAEQGGVKITGSVQNLFSSRRSVADALKISLNRVQIIQATLGGSFGGKDEVMTSMCCRAALLAMKTGKPVKMVNTREESMLESYKRHPYVMYYKWGARKDGTITAMEIRCIADGGAYSSMSPFVTWRSVVQATGPYYCENVKTDVYAAYTNNNYTGAMRGFGSPQVNFAIESMMDELAEHVGMTPLEIRLKNGFENYAVTATGQKLNHTVSLKQVLREAAQAIDFDRKWREYRGVKEGEKKRGVGIACSYRGVSLGAEGTDAAETIVSVQTDGSVIVSSGVTDMGQGAQTQMSQIAAEVLGISMDRIQFLNTNTSRVADSGPTVASRGTIMGGSAAKNAAEKVRATLLEVGAEMTGVEIIALDLADNYLIRKNSMERLASFGELTTACFNKGKPMIGLGWHKSPPTSWHEEEGTGEAYFTFVYGANAAEVEVDTGTGKVDVVDFVSVHDVGKAINRGMVIGQMCGGVAMGLGYGLLEDFEIEDAIPKQLNFDEYLIPTSMDVPRIKTIIVENEDPAGPFGAKSVGEPTNELAAPAIVNAIFNATGKRIYEIPATLERVLLGHKLSRSGKRGSEQKNSLDSMMVESCKNRGEKG
ncbi:MAG: xanthine dehydrogenase family protein molybdopterin-binding subunit [Ignavibacteriales bacterium]|nr:xanthine dehydrogenase family protein molybdopterin-binding subunit [Ignavibacteriales bacterium]